MGTKLGFQTTLPASMPSSGQSGNARYDGKTSANAAPQAHQNSPQTKGQEKRQAFLMALRKNKDLFSAEAVIDRSNSLSKKP